MIQAIFCSAWSKFYKTEIVSHYWYAKYTEYRYIHLWRTLNISSWIGTSTLQEMRECFKVKFVAQINGAHAPTWRARPPPTWLKSLTKIAYFAWFDAPGKVQKPLRSFFWCWTCLPFVCWWRLVFVVLTGEKMSLVTSDRPGRWLGCEKNGL